MITLNLIVVSYISLVNIKYDKIAKKKSKFGYLLTKFKITEGSMRNEK